MLQCSERISTIHFELSNCNIVDITAFVRKLGPGATDESARAACQKLVSNIIEDENEFRCQDECAPEVGTSLRGG